MGREQVVAPAGAYVAWKMSSGAAETLEGWRAAQRSFCRQTRVVRPRASSSSSREQRTAVAQVKATAATATACSATPRTIVALSSRSSQPPLHRAANREQCVLFNSILLAKLYTL